MPKRITIYLILLISVFYGCATPYSKLKIDMKEGISSQQVEVILKSHASRYSFVMCSELQKKMGNLTRPCVHPNSKGAYIGWVNDGSFMLGMGSSDIHFQIEISSEGDVVDIFTYESNTFL